MNEIVGGSLDAPAPQPFGAVADVDVLSGPSGHEVDRSMLVVQYALAFVAAVAAILLTQVS